MIRIVSNRLRAPFAAAATVALLAACADDAPLAPESQPAFAAQTTALPAKAETNRALATLRRVTARYHDLNAAIADGFVFLHECEERPGEGPVGIVYIHFDRLLDGRIDPALPDGLVYEPAAVNGKPKLVAAEFAVPYALWTDPEPPQFQGATFQSEDEFGVYGLHAWVWRHNPEGMFAESNPLVSCEPA
jgi:hypothetical protein